MKQKNSVGEINKIKTKKEKLKQNNLSSTKIVLQTKIIKETKNLEIGAEKKHAAEKTFLRSKNFISVAKTLFCVAKILLALQKNIFA